ncbi:hypothetical protein NC651_032294 [Populus alba x Populus x berolinensis]|nr:hypothetical protein NC651_032294 [Populus alba x Populus x berolinensis]
MPEKVVSCSGYRAIGKIDHAGASWLFQSLFYSVLYVHILERSILCIWFVPCFCNAKIMIGALVRCCTRDNFPLRDINPSFMIIFSPV